MLQFLFLLFLLFLFFSFSSSFYFSLYWALNNLGVPWAPRRGEWAPRQWLTSRTAVNPGPPSTVGFHSSFPATRCRQPSFVASCLKSSLRMITGAPSSLIKPPGSSFMAKCHPVPRVFSFTRTSFSSRSEAVNERRVVLLRCWKAIVFQVVWRKEVFDWRLTDQPGHGCKTVFQH